MAKNFSFGFYLTLSDDVVLNDADVTFGKESSSFTMKVQNAQPEPIIDNQKANAIVLLSDAFVNESFLSHSHFAVCDTVPFRNIVNTTSSSHKYYGIHKSTVRIQLLKKGSVFIAKEGSLRLMKDELEIQANFRKIGYNNFQLIKIGF
jgi:hypothetical protein